MFRGKQQTPTRPDGSKSEPSESLSARQQSRPKLLLVDLPDGVAEQISSAGFTVAEGTFGRPYKTPVGDNFVPVVPEASLPGLNEQEIVVVDLTRPSTSHTSPGEKRTSMGTLDLWARASLGEIDPRPAVMQHVQDRCDRILNHGGVFIVFVEPRNDPGYVLGQATRHGFQNRGSVDATDWDFLSLLATDDYIMVKPDHGRELEPAEDASFLNEHLDDASFSATLANGYALGSERWLPLAKNKFGQTVAAVILSGVERDSASGGVFLLPQIADKAALLLDFLDDVLPRVFPHLFPQSDKLGWVHEREYELPRVRAIADEVARLEEEYESRITKLREEAAVVQADEGWQYDLLRGTGEKLVEAVKQALAALGFERVEDVDATVTEGAPRREDLRVHDRSPLLLVEVKGIAGTGREAGTLQVTKYVAPRMREFSRTDVQGLSVVNHQRNLAPRDRQGQPFQEDVLVNAEEQQFGIITGVDLFRLVRNAQELQWRPDDVGDLFYKFGRIDPVPSHYEFVGMVDGFWERVPALGIQVEHGPIRVGDALAFELPIAFIEEQVESIQIGNSDVTEATDGQHVAVHTSLTKKQARKGVRVFRVRPREKNEG